MSKFIIKNIGNGLGDCFIIHMAGETDECVIIVDGHKENQGNLSFEHMKESIKEYKKIDYIVITHIDDDHIGGILKLLSLPSEDEIFQKLNKTVFIYNSIVRSTINYKQAEHLELLLNTRKIINTCKIDYSKCTQGYLILLSQTRRDSFDPANYQLYKNRPILTFIHPTDSKDIEQVQEDYIKRKATGNLTSSDSKLINRNSIAFLIEFMGKCVFFTGDAYVEDIFPKVSVKNIDIIKIPHHGADLNNRQLPQYAKNFNCQRFIVTGEKKWSKIHPAQSLLTNLYQILGNKLTIYTKVDMAEYEHCSETIKNTEEIDVMEDYKDA